MGADLQHFPLGQLEGEQDAAANLDGILDGLQAGGEGFPLVVAEVGVGGACGQHEVVVRDFGSAAEADATAFEVEGDGFVHEDFGVGVVAQDGADGRSDLGRRKNRQRHLIEERLEREVIAAVDHSDVHRQLRQRFGGVGSGKACAEDHDARAAMGLLCDHCGSSSPYRRDAPRGRNDGNQLWAGRFSGQPKRARPTVRRKSSPCISTTTHISARRERMRSPMRSPRVSSRMTRPAPLLPLEPPGARSA